MKNMIKMEKEGAINQHSLAHNVLCNACKIRLE